MEQLITNFIPGMGGFPGFTGGPGGFPGAGAGDSPKPDSKPQESDDGLD